MRLCFCAINGTGLGHLRRAVNIAREARLILEALDLRPELRIVTTSDAPQIARGVSPVYKLPSKTTARQLGLEPRAFTAEARMILSGLVASFRPHVLVQDTRPEGVYQEFAFIRDHAQASAFIGRHTDPAQTQKAAYRAHLALYNRILVPDDADQAQRYLLPPALAERRQFVGAIQGFRRATALTRAEVQQRYGLPDDAWIVYVSAGGGGDPEAEAQLDVLIETLLSAHDDAHLLIGHGPLYQGVHRRGPRVHPVVELEASALFSGVDAAFSAAGYNSHQELLAAQVPTAFFAQPKGLDRQDLRVARGVEQGLHLALPALAPETIALVSAQLRRPEVLDPMRRALAERPFPLGALKAAEALLRLAADHGRSAIDRSALRRAVALRRQQILSGAPDSESTLTHHALETWLQATRSPSQLDDLTASMYADDAEWQARGPALIEQSQHLARLAASAAWSPGDLRRWLEAYGRAPHGPGVLDRRLQGVLERLDTLPAPTALDLLELCRQVCRNADLAELLDACFDDGPPPMAQLRAIAQDGLRSQPLEICLERIFSPPAPVPPS
ncbi:MAG: hypothetical protein ACE366_20115 [Bradymonadia bacterium]